MVYVCGEHVSMIDELSNCADLIKRTLDDNFGVGWVVIIVNVKSKLNSQKNKLQFGANYSLSDKVDMKIFFFKTVYVNIFRLTS